MAAFFQGMPRLQKTNSIVLPLGLFSASFGRALDERQELIGEIRIFSRTLRCAERFKTPKFTAQEVYSELSKSLIDKKKD